MLHAQLTAAARSGDPRGALARLARLGTNAVLRALASLQDGQFATGQAHALGLTPAAVKWLAACGETASMRRGVWRFNTAPGDPDRAVTAWLACWPHATISHGSAAAHHGLPGIPEPPLAQIIVPHGQTRALAGVTIHRSHSLPGVDRVGAGAVIYTTKARTVCDLADPRDLSRTLSLVDDAIAGGVRRSWLHARATALANGRGGVRVVRDATAPDAAAVFRSWLERAAGHVYRVAGLPEPEWNVPVDDARGRIGIVDALWRPWRVVSEKEGLRFHTSPRQRRTDAERFNRLLDADYTARRFTWLDVVERPVYVATTVARSLRNAGADVDLARIPRQISVPGRPYRGGWVG